MNALTSSNFGSPDPTYPIIAPKSLDTAVVHVFLITLQWLDGVILDKCFVDVGLGKNVIGISFIYESLKWFCIGYTF